MTDINNQVRQSVALALGNLTLQMIELQAVIQQQAQQLTLEKKRPEGGINADPDLEAAKKTGKGYPSIHDK